MKTTLLFGSKLLLVSALLVAMSGCAAFRANTRDVDVSQDRHFDAKFDYSDLRNFTEKAATELAASDFVQAVDGKPIMMIAGLENRTSQYVDTKNMTDRMRTLLFKTGEFRFVNEARRDDLIKEQGYQAANVPAATRLKVGQQLGANFMMSGSLTEMRQTSPDQVRVSRKKVRYYKQTLEVTDLTSGELLWTDEQEMARQASQPIIRW